VNTFNQAVAFSLKWEGDYSFDKDDPGGETKYGISKRAYPDVDIKSLTKLEAERLYKKDYWDKAGCDSMEPKLAIAVFDSAVNCGVGRVRSWLSERESPQDIRWFIQRRIQYYLDLVKKKPALNKYSKGWLNRTNDLSKYVDIVTAN
jgi:hypothetical protein